MPKPYFLPLIWLLMPGDIFASRARLAAEEDHGCAQLNASLNSAQADPQRDELIATCGRNGSNCQRAPQELQRISAVPIAGLDCGGKTWTLADSSWSSESTRSGGQILTNRSTGVEVYVSTAGIAAGFYDPRTGVQQSLAIPLVKIQRNLLNDAARRNLAGPVSPRHFPGLARPFRSRNAPHFGR